MISHNPPNSAFLLISQIHIILATQKHFQNRTNSVDLLISLIQSHFLSQMISRRVITSPLVHRSLNHDHLHIQNHSVTQKNSVIPTFSHIHINSVLHTAFLNRFLLHLLHLYCQTTHFAQFLMKKET